MLFNYAIALLIGGLIKLVDEKNIKYLPLVYFVLALLINLVFSEDPDLGSLVIAIAIKSVLVYAWVILLHKFEETIFAYLILLVAGAYLLNLF